MAKIQWLHFPLFIKWYITTLCNLRCSHCYLTDYTDRGLEDKAIQFVDFFWKKGVRNIIILGGEPLIRRDLETVTGRIVGHNINVKIATNGILATRDRARSLVSSGAKFFQVSIESHSQDMNDTVRGTGSFPKIMEGIRNLKNAGAHVVLAATIGKNNYRDILMLHQLSRDIGVDKLKLSAFAPLGTGCGHLAEFLLDREIVSSVRHTLQDLTDQYPNLQVDSVFLRNMNKNHDASQPYTFGCGAGTTTMILNSDLSISACDLLVEKDRTKVKVKSPEEIEMVWKTDPLFKKWRGLEFSENGPLKTFQGVHQNGCQVNYSSYGENLFR